MGFLFNKLDFGAKKITSGILYWVHVQKKHEAELIFVVMKNNFIFTFVSNSLTTVNKFSAFFNSGLNVVQQTFKMSSKK